MLIDTRILCLSGGLDSMIAYFYLGEPRTIFFDTGGYADAEKEIVLKIAPDTIIDTSLNFTQISTNEKAFIPNRNLLFAARAMAYAPTVVIAGVKDDKVSDKNEKAFDSMTQVLRRINGVSPTDPGSLIKVYSPFWEMTKAEIVNEFLNFQAGAEELIDLSISCYTPVDGKECLSCPSCFRKWNALWENGIQRDFKNIQLMREYLHNAENGKYIEERNKSIMKCVLEFNTPEKSTYCFDIDGVLTNETEGHNYEKRTPNRRMIKQVNLLHNEGHRIILNTARWGTDWTVTKAWLHKYSVCYHELYLGKPKADFYIDDNMISMEELLNG